MIWELVFIVVILHLCMHVSLWHLQATYDARRCVFRNEHCSALIPPNLYSVLKEKKSIIIYAILLLIWNSGIAHLPGWECPCSCCSKTMLTPHREVTLSSFIIRDITPRFEWKCGTQVSTSVMSPSYDQTVAVDLFLPPWEIHLSNYVSLCVWFIFL